jgi:glycosidase
MKIKFSTAQLIRWAVLALVVSFNFRSAAALATCWHIPDNTSDLGFNMRNPETAIGASTTVKFYTGVWKYNGATQLCNQTGGVLYFKTSTQSSWSSTNLSFYSNTAANQYWQTTLPGGVFNANVTVQYFFLLTFDGTGSTGATNTWLYGNNAGSTATGSSNTAAASPFTFTISNNIVGTPVLTVNGVNADYTTTHVFVNELNADTAPLTISFAPNGGAVTNVEIFSNVNRRDRVTLDANGDGIEDGILPPDGNLIFAGNTNNYYQAYPMTNVGGGNYSLTLNATKTGAYRLTARFQVVGSTNWIWYSGGSTGRRDHALVVTPTKARDITMYELNAMTIGSQGIQEDDRSTFTDLYNGPGSRGYDAVTNRFNLDYVKNLGVNWLWFQPIHPSGVQNRQTDPDTGQPYTVGSPYAVKNFFQVNPLMSKANTRAAALVEFTNFVAAADAKDVNIMLDEPFNHSAWDAELDASGVYYFKTNAQPTDTFSSSEARFYSRTDAYDQRAFSAGSVAQAPDRYDFGKWTDVADIYFGRYAALVANSGATGNQVNEGDWFDYSVGSDSSAGSGNGHFDRTTQNVWRYFADCLLYWLDKTGCPAGTPANQTYKGIDGLRADFGQGIPPQCWEYIINKVRSRKWDFVFMTESLDGGAVTYRSNRHFDILNENLIFSLQSASTATDYRSALESRRTAYGQALLLLNHVSHDEQSYSDPYQALIRHAVVSTIDGAPMVFYGEELGISTAFGFNLYESNFGKNIPHFKKFNSMQPIFNPANRNYGLDQLWPVYAGINQARSFSKALRNSNRYFLDQTGGGAQTKIFSVAKYEIANAAPGVSDVVFAFTSLDRNNAQQGNFNVNITQNGANLFGIKSNRVYNAKNIAAYTAIDGNRRNVWQWGAGVAGSNIIANGIFVSLYPVPSLDVVWSIEPFEAQYLKLYDVTPPPVPATVGVVGTTNSYVFTNVVTFTWSPVNDLEGGVSGYHVVVGNSTDGSGYFTGDVSGTTITVTNTYGTHLFCSVSAINNAGIRSSSFNFGLITLVNPAWIPVASMATPTLLSWSSVAGQVYQVWTTTNLALPFVPYGGTLTALSSMLSVTNQATDAVRYFKVRWLP